MYLIKSNQGRNYDYFKSFEEVLPNQITKLLKKKKFHVVTLCVTFTSLKEFVC